MKTAGQSPVPAGNAAEAVRALPEETPDPGGAGDFGVDPLFPPSLGEALREVIAAARTVWSPSFLVPAWCAALLLWLGWEFAAPRLSASTGGVVRTLLLAGGVAATVVLIWLVSALLVVMSAWVYGRGTPMGLRPGLRFIGKRCWPILSSLLFVPLGALALLMLVAGGAAALGALPGVGRWLAGAWLIFPGFPFTLLLAGFLLLAVPAVPLILSAAALEAPFPFDAVARGMSYVRANPGRYLALLLGGALGAAFGTVVFAGFAGMVVAILFAASRAGDLALAGMWNDLIRVVQELDPAWPFGPRPAAGTGAGAILLGAAGRILTGFAAAAMLSALARTYLLLRWTQDGESPAALLRPDEDFGWVAVSSPLDPPEGTGELPGPPALRGSSAGGPEN